MTRRALVGALAAGAVGLVWGAAPATAAPCANATTVVTALNISDIEAAVRCLTNVERQRYGLPALGQDTRLDSASRAHSEWMESTNTFSHTGSGGSSPGSRATAAGYIWDHIAENIYTEWSLPSSTATPVEAVNAWMASLTGHCQNLLNPIHRDQGAGVANGSASNNNPGGTFTQMFGREDGEAPGTGSMAGSNSCPHPRNSAADSDGDGLTDGDPNRDNCPLVSNPGQEDADTDGAGDACDPDAVPTVTANVADDDVTEGTGAGTSTLQFQVSLSAPAPSAITLSYATSPGTASAGSDYTTASAQLNFAAGEQSKTVNVTVVRDTAPEPTETMTLTVGAVSGPVTIADGTATGTILDDDLIAANVADDSATEGSGAGTTTLDFDVSLAQPSIGTTTLSYTTANGTATQPADYTLTTGQLVFTNGQQTKTVNVPVARDTVPEPTETMTLTIDEVSGKVLVADGSATGTILDDDPMVAAVNDPTMLEGSNAGTTNLQFQISLSHPAKASTTLSYTTGNGSATTPSDYASTSGQVVFTQGEQFETVNVPIVRDTVPEPDETLTLTIGVVSGPTTLGDATGTGTIDDDDPVRVNIADAAITEGTGAGTTKLQFPVTLSHPSVGITTLSVAAANGSATQPADFANPAGQLVFANGEQAKVVEVTVVRDAVHELDETMGIGLAVDSGHATIQDGTATGTITDDDPIVASVADDTEVEGTGAGSTQLGFVVSLSEPASTNITLNYATSNGTATAPGDYTAASSQVTFTPGQQNKTVNVTVVRDAAPEPDETLTLAITPASGPVAIGDGSATGTIDDDDLVSVNVGDDTVTEGTGPGTTKLEFPVSLSHPSVGTTTISYETADGTAVQPGDYTAATGQVVFGPGEQNEVVEVVVARDSTPEPDETVALGIELVSGHAAVVDGAATGTIDDDDAVSASVADGSATEGTGAGTTTLEFEVSLSAPATGTTTVAYATTNGSAGAADFTAANGQLVFQAGEQSKDVNVAVTRDAVPEPDETLTLAITPAGGLVTISDGTATGTIFDDDPVGAVVQDTTQLEGTGAGTTTMQFTVALSQPATATTTLSYATSNGSATQPGDYTSTSGQLVFTPGQSQKTVPVTIVRDTVPELDETLTVTIDEVSGPVSVTDATATGTIDDDDPVGVSVADDGVTEGTGGGSTVLEFEIALAQPALSAAEVSYVTVPGTAAAATDYTHVSDSVVFAAGESSTTVQVPVTRDALPEPDETLSLSIGVVSGHVVLTDSSATGTIDDDDPVGAAVADAGVVEGDGGGTTDMQFQVSLSQPATATTRVSYATSNGSATQPGDYTATSGQLEFLTGQQQGTVTVPVVADDTAELDETLTVTIDEVSGPVTVTDATATGTIDDDDPVGVSVADDGVTEGTGAGTTVLEFEIALAQPALSAAEVSYVTSAGTATAGSDFTHTSGSVQFLAGEASKTVQVPVTRDAVPEVSESLSLSIGVVSGHVAPADSTAVGTIEDDDPVGATVADAAVTEGDGGGTSDLQFQVSLSHPATAATKLFYAISNGMDGELDFASGEQHKTVTVPVARDDTPELNETLTLTMSAVSGPVVVTDGTATGTIIDDDPVGVSVADDGVTEGTGGGSTVLEFEISLAQPALNPTQVSYATSNGTAEAPADFTQTSGSVEFLAGESSKTVQVPVTSDTLPELSETLTLSIGVVSGHVALADGSATGTITDDDPVGATVADASVLEGDGSGTTELAFLVSLSHPATAATTLSFSTADGTATQPADYTATTGQLQFSAGEQHKAMIVPVVRDDADEPNETLTLTMVAAGGLVVVTDGTAVGTITNDDAPSPTITTPPAGGGSGTSAGTGSAGGDTGGTGTTTTPPPPPPPPPPSVKTVAVTTLASVPSARRCVSRRRFRIRLRKPRGDRVTSARVFVNGKRVKTVSGKRLTAPVDLRGLPRGRITVRIEVRTASGKTLRGSRRYRTCTPKRRSR